MSLDFFLIRDIILMEFCSYKSFYFKEVYTMKQIWNFVLTGGPCSGKTTALSTIEQELSSRGYYVLIVP